jgi:phosphotransferase system IIB component
VCASAALDHLVAGLGGPTNIVRVTADHTRTNVWLLDPDRIDHAALRGAGLRGNLVGSRHLQLVTAARTPELAAGLAAAGGAGAAPPLPPTHRGDDPS